MDISLFRAAILLVIATVVISVVRNLLKNKNAAPAGTKPLPGPEGKLEPWQMKI